MSTKKQQQILFKIILLSMFIAIMMVMNFTPIGYIPTPYGFSVTLMLIPVALGAACASWYGGIVLGAVFGLTSFLQAFGVGATVDIMAASLFQENPLKYSVMCFVPRILAGLLSALVFALFKRMKKVGILAFAVSALVVPIVNTTLFMSMYIMFYSNTPLGGVVQEVVKVILAMNFLCEAALTLLASTAINKTVYNYAKRYL